MLKRHLISLMLAGGGLATSVATSQAGPPLFRAVVLPSLDGGNTQAYDINDYGVVTGESGASLVSVGTHAFIWREGQAMERIDIPGSDISKGVAINNAGAVAGSWTYFPRPERRIGDIPPERRRNRYRRWLAGRSVGRGERHQRSWRRRRLVVDRQRHTWLHLPRRDGPDHD